jgi:Flp pilus assembly pilin Flp
MLPLISTFFQDEDGAVTVDFVVLTAAICLLGFVVVTTFSGSAIALGNDIENSMLNMNAGG